MPPKKQSKDVLNIVTTGEKLGNLIKLVKRYSDAMGDSSWRFYKKGIQIHSIDAAFVCMLEVAVGKGYFTKYTAAKEFKIAIGEYDLETLREICALAGDEELTLRIPDNMNNFLMKYGNVNRKMKVPTEEAQEAKGDTITNVYKGTKIIGNINMEELRLFLKASATWKGDSERICIVEKKGSAFEMKTVIDDKMDEVILDLNKSLKNKLQG